MAKTYSAGGVAHGAKYLRLTIDVRESDGERRRSRGKRRSSATKGRSSGSVAHSPAHREERWRRPAVPGISSSPKATIPTNWPRWARNIWAATSAKPKSCATRSCSSRTYPAFAGSWDPLPHHVRNSRGLTSIQTGHRLRATKTSPDAQALKRMMQPACL